MPLGDLSVKHDSVQMQLAFGLMSTTNMYFDDEFALRIACNNDSSSMQRALNPDRG